MWEVAYGPESGKSLEAPYLEGTYGAARRMGGSSSRAACPEVPSLALE